MRVPRCRRARTVRLADAYSPAVQCSRARGVNELRRTVARLRQRVQPVSGGAFGIYQRTDDAARFVAELAPARARVDRGRWLHPPDSRGAHSREPHTGNARPHLERIDENGRVARMVARSRGARRTRPGSLRPQRARAVRFTDRTPPGFRRMGRLVGLGSRCHRGIRRSITRLLALSNDPCSVCVGAYGPERSYDRRRAAPLKGPCQGQTPIRPRHANRDPRVSLLPPASDSRRDCCVDSDPLWRAVQCVMR